ncbi:MAG: chromosome segregation protein SMC, partial [Myxococcaceae bacterium]
FTFDDGVTGIVGPNGCGKSNVVDAIRWAMGEQSAKNLRGRGMEDVIFNGSETHSPLNMAEVSLTFKVEDGDVLAPQYAGFPEVTITRRLFRDGTSEYLINKTICRLLDVTELFLGTGVGTKAYSIIEQGRVGLIVSSKPEDRRSLIEEAAGITKYKNRRKAAERKMEATEANLLRVTDIVNELEKRLDSLQRQAKKAEKYKKLKADMRELELHAASHRFLELQAEQKLLLEKLENVSGEEKTALETVQRLDAEITEKRAALENDSRTLGELTERVHTLESQAQLDAQNLGHWKHDLEETKKRLESATGEKWQLEARDVELKAAAAAREAELSSISGNWREDEQLAASSQEELKAVTSQQSELLLKLDMDRAALVALASRLANHESNLNALQRQKADLEARMEKNRAEAETLRSQEKELEKTRTDVAKRVNESRQMALELAERRTMEEEALGRTRAEFAENEVVVISLREALGDKRSRLQSLEEIQRNYEGFDRGVRAVMIQAGSEAREKGIFGLVADVVTVTPRFERAIEAALGEKLQHIVVESRNKGLELIEFLKSAAEGRSTFLPVESVKDPGELNRPELSRDGVVAWALSEVKFEDALGPAVRALLADVVIVEDLRSARESQASAPQWTYVTVEGEVLRPDGTMTAGTLEGAAVGALHKKREIAELSQDLKETEERYNEILTRHYALQKQMSHAEGVLKGLEKNRHTEELSAATQEKDLHRAGEDLSRIRERVNGLDVEHLQLTQQHQAVGSEEENSRGEVAHGAADREQREERVRQLTSELETLKHRHEALSAEVTSLRVKVAAATEKGEAARKDLETIRSQQTEVTSRIERAVVAMVEAENRAEELTERITATETGSVERTTQLEELKKTLESGKVTFEAASAAVKDQETQLKEIRTRLESVSSSVGEITLREKELQLERNHLVEQMQERHGVQLAEEIHNYHLLPPLPPESQEKLKELRAQAEKMGEINLTAIDEHAELSTRFEFLSGQKKDLEASLENLKDAIDRINKTSRERFKESFEVINEKFQQVYPRLFNGGRAGLVLTEEGQGHEQGVEILAQPPGKKLQSVNLMSGGEKALTAVALIFAIFLIKPTPFCLLDEVDAPLDEGNVGRYNDMVKEMSKQSQFILITHNKRTMEVGDALYGVTMEEPGISKLVSVKIKESVAANDNTHVA